MPTLAVEASPGLRGCRVGETQTGGGNSGAMGLISLGKEAKPERLGGLENRMGTISHRYNADVAAPIGFLAVIWTTTRAGECRVRTPHVER